MHHSPSLCLTTAVATAFLLSALPGQWVGEFKLDETTGTTAADLSPAANDGTLMNFTGTTHWGPGKFGGSLTFDGSDDYVELKSGTGLPVYAAKGSPFSISFWVKAPAQTDKRVYSEGSDSSNTPIITFGSGTSGNTSKLRVYFRNDSGRVVCTFHSSAVVFDDTWHHVAWSDASGTTALYIDGVLDGTDHYGTHPGSPNFGTFSMNKASIGAVLRASSCCLLTGSVDDLRIYNYAVTKADVDLMLLDVSLLPCSGSIGYYGKSCNGNLDIWAAGKPKIGDTIYLSLSRGTPGANGMLLVSPAIAPFDLGAIGLPGCFSYPALASSFILAVGTLDRAGTVSPIPFPIPNSSALDCVLAGLQGAAASGPSLEVSGAVMLHIGR